MSGRVVANREDIAKLRAELDTAAGEYKANYTKLKAVVDQIKSGEFKGDPADAFVAYFDAQDPTFTGIQSEIDEAYGYIEEQEHKIVGLMDNLTADMSQRRV